MLQVCIMFESIKSCPKIINTYDLSCIDAEERILNKIYFTTVFGIFFSASVFAPTISLTQPRDTKLRTQQVKPNTITAWPHVQALLESVVTQQVECNYHATDDKRYSKIFGQNPSQYIGHSPTYIFHLCHQNLSTQQKTGELQWHHCD